MAISRLYVDGEAWEIMGNVIDNFLPYSNTLEASRSGRVYSNTEAKVKMVKVDAVKLDRSEFDEIATFLSECAGKRFNVTVSLDEDCGDGLIEYHYTGCQIQGEPEFSIFEKKVSGFEFGYERRVIKNEN